MLVVLDVCGQLFHEEGMVLQVGCDVGHLGVAERVLGDVVVGDVEEVHNLRLISSCCYQSIYYKLFFILLLTYSIKQNLPINQNLLIKVKF